eukprot:1905103-Pleurochrysis_carterae.AAC.1
MQVGSEEAGRPTEENCSCRVRNSEDRLILARAVRCDGGGGGDGQGREGGDRGSKQAHRAERN